MGADNGFGLPHDRMDYGTAHPSVRDSSLGVAGLRLCAPAVGCHQSLNTPSMGVAVAAFLGVRLVAADSGQCPLGSNAQRVSKFPFADSADGCSDGGFASTA